ncbi:MAG: FAD-binding dehydrogenase, partial [bacterium]|nr:FAD-binding dehydrogenase [bacterium]
FDRPEDSHPREWAEAYLHFAAGEKRSWLREEGVRIFPVVGWAERGDGRAEGHGNSVPRFHIVWGTGPGVLEPFVRRLRGLIDRGRVQVRFRHRVDGLLPGDDGGAAGVHGVRLAPTREARGRASSRDVVGEFEVRAGAVVMASGGIGGNLEAVRKAWPRRLGAPPSRMVAGVPAHVDGRGIALAEAAGARVVNRDRMWHYTEGIRNWDPVWENHGIRILPGPSSLWLDAEGRRLPAPCYPGFDTLSTLRHLRGTGHDYSWFVLTQSVIEKEFALSGSEQNPDLTGRDLRLLLQRVVGEGAPGPVEAFKTHGSDFVVADSLDELVAGMNRLAAEYAAEPGFAGEAAVLDVADVRALVEARDREIENEFTKDAQLALVRNHRAHRGDRIIRTAAPHRFLDPEHGPLIAVRLHVLTRKTLGGLWTDLDARCLREDGSVFPGLFAVGEAAGFGGGGMMGYNALEGTFLGGCLFSGLQAGRAVAG